MKKNDDDKDFAGAMNISIVCGFESSTVFVVRATMAQPFPDTVPAKLKESMMMALLSESLRLEASRLTKELEKDDWAVETHEVDGSTEQQH